MSVRKPKRRKNYLSSNIISTAVINAFVQYCSSPRAVMDANHVGSRVPLKYPEVRKCYLEGIELELAKCIDDVRTTKDCVIKAIVRKLDDPDLNPESVVFVEFEKNGRLVLDIIHVPRTRTHHTVLGYELEHTDALLNSGLSSDILPAGTILAKTASYDEETRSYMFGINASICAMSHRGTGEDAMVVSESLCERATYTTLVDTVLDFKSTMIPVNKYGDLNYFKIFPELGEICEDGYLCAWRDRIDMFSIADTNNEDICKIDHMHDDKPSVRPGSRVVDIKVYPGKDDKIIYSENMCTQLRKYVEMERIYCESIIRRYNRICYDMGRRHLSDGVVEETGRLKAFIREKMNYLEILNPKNKNKVSKRNSTIDQFRVEIRTMADVVPGRGNKFTDTSGGKGTVSMVLPDSHMPVLNGRRADMIIDGPSARGARMNLCGSYGGYIGACSRDLLTKLQDKLEDRYGNKFLTKIQDKDVLEVFDTIHDYMSYINPVFTDKLATYTFEQKEAFVFQNLLGGIIPPYPSNNEFNAAEVISCLRDSPYAADRGHVTFKDIDGEDVVSLEETSIWEDYIMLLDRTGDDYSGVSTARVNSFMLPSKGGDYVKNKYPHSLTPVTTSGETETRILLANAPPDLQAEIYDLSSNPITLEQITTHMLTCDGMIDEDFDIDRTINPYGNGRPVTIVKHVFRGAGVVIGYQEEEFSYGPN